MSPPGRSVEELLRAGRDLLEESRRLARSLDEQLRRFREADESRRPATPDVPDGFEVRTVVDGRLVWLFLAGTLGIGAVRHVRVAFDDALYLNPGRDVALDMSRVVAIDGEGVLAVLGLVDAASRERRSLAIVNASEEIAAQMRLMGIISAYGGYQLSRSI